jgi:pyrroline-5-carboxylate reductase
MTGFIGGGNMAEALIKGMAGKGREDILVSEIKAERRKYLEKTYGVKAMADNRALVASSDIVMLAVKPQDMAVVLDEIADSVTEKKTVVSIAAGITLSFLKERLKTDKIVRVMPNVAAISQEGMSVLSLCECFPDADMAKVRDVFMSSGRVLVLPEKHMDAVTALSGSGPAFIALFVGAMAEAGAGMGLSEDNACELAVQTLRGTAELLAGGIPPVRLIEMVRSPGGTTAAGLEVFEEKGLKGIVRAALEAAAGRSRELAR